MPDVPVKDRRFIIFGLRIATNFGVALAAPAVVFVSGGRWLDKRYDTSPWLTILAFVLSALLSTVYINRKARQYGSEYQRLINESLNKRDTANGLNERDKIVDSGK